jgi:hypothetical protein
LGHGFFAHVYILAGARAGDDLCELGLRLLLRTFHRDVADLPFTAREIATEFEFEAPRMRTAAGDVANAH